ncbi:hypothetical protein [Nocardia sp. NPDC004722]
MPTSPSTTLLVVRTCTAIAGFAAIAAATTLTGNPPTVLAGTDVGSAISPSGLAAGSTSSSPHQCTAAGLAISISGESAVDCSGITTGSS